MKGLALAVGIFVSRAIVTFAGVPISSSKEVIAPAHPPPLASFFRPNEFVIGAFATYVTGTQLWFAMVELSKGGRLQGSPELRLGPKRMRRSTSSTIPWNALGADSNALSSPRSLRGKPSRLQRWILRNLRLPSPLHPRYTTCASRMMMDHDKPAVDFQRADAGIDLIARRPETARDRRLTPVYWASPDRRRGLAHVSVLRRFDRQ